MMKAAALALSLASVAHAFVPGAGSRALAAPRRASPAGAGRDVSMKYGVDLTGKVAFVAGVADSSGYGWAIAKALAEAGATITVGTWPPVLGIFQTSLEKGRFDDDMKLSDGSMMKIEKARARARARARALARARAAARARIASRATARPRAKSRARFATRAVLFGGGAASSARPAPARLSSRALAQDLSARRRVRYARRRAGGREEQQAVRRVASALVGGGGGGGGGTGRCFPRARARARRPPPPPAPAAPR